MNKTFTKFKSRLLAAVAIAVFAAMPAFAQNNFILGPTPNGTSGNLRGPSGAADFQRTSTIYLGSEFPGLAAGPINAVGFSINAPAATVASGNIKIYMANTTDVTYNRGATWATILTTPTAMTLVYDGPLTIPVAIGPFNVTLTTPFAYTGGNFYFAYEWNATTKSATSATYDANTPSQNLVTISAATLAGTASLTGTSTFRPVLNLGVPAPANDVQVKAVFVQGKVALNANTPQAVRAVVRNNSAATVTNRTFTLNVSGGNTFTSSVTLASLPRGIDSVITFPAFTPTTISTSNFVEVTSASDNNNSNNVAEANMVVTQATQGYAQYPTTATGPLAVQTALPGQFPSTGRTFTNVNGNFLVKFTSTGRTRVNTVRAYVPGAAFNPIVNTTNATLYGVVFNSAGVEIARSGNVVLTATAVDKLVEFTLTTPATFNNNEVYYVGMAMPVQPTATATIYPMAAQNETNAAIRRGTFYVSPVSTTAAVPSEFIDDLRFVIEADVTNVTGVKEEMNAKLVSVYPNPSNGEFKVSAKDMKGSNLNLVVRDLQGKLVYSANGAKEGASIDLKNVAAGVYMLQVSTDAEIAIKRLVIE